MNKLKITLTCSYCTKIFKNPVELPCKHNVCKEHLIEKDVQKQNKIKCVECKKEFQVKAEMSNRVDYIIDYHVDYIIDYVIVIVIG
jgi:c-di-AMP phosphodiesterase-like protein